MNRQQRRRQEKQGGRTGAPLAAVVGAAEAHHRAGRWAEAAGLYERALEADPGLAPVRANLAAAVYNLGNARARADDPAGAAACFERAVELRPGFAEAHGNLVRMLLAGGRPALAAAVRAVQEAGSGEARRLFVQCARDQAVAEPGSEVRALLTRAFTEGWGRPVDLARAAARLLTGGTRAEMAQDPLLLAHLVGGPVTDAGLERRLTALRAELLQAADEDDLPLRCALARQCFLNEYVFNSDSMEAGTVAGLAAGVEQALASNEPVRPGRLAALAAYRPLTGLAGAGRLLEFAWPEPVGGLLTQQLREPAAEAAVERTLPCLTPLTDAVSVAVRDQYERNPYPRWTLRAEVEATTLDGFLSRLFPGRYRVLERAAPDILVAGCGTGQHAIATAGRFPAAKLVAIDLSRASLAYAQQRSGAARIIYAQADLLHAAALDRSFDSIEASGVLHHLAEPMAGWRALLSVLRPGGVMRLGFYSALGRRHVVAAREVAQGFAPSPDGIRQCRRALLGLPLSALARQVTESADFHTISTCRDLLFHVQEHRLTLPAIAGFLEAEGLILLGFDVAAGTLQRYRARFPHDVSATDLASWDRFEQEEPDCFTGMYQFWVQRGP